MKNILFTAIASLLLQFNAMAKALPATDTKVSILCRMFSATKGDYRVKELNFELTFNEGNQSSNEALPKLLKLDSDDGRFAVKSTWIDEDNFNAIILVDKVKKRSATIRTDLNFKLLQNSFDLNKFDGEFNEDMTQPLVQLGIASDKVDFENNGVLANDAYLMCGVKNIEALK